MIYSLQVVRFSPVYATPQSWAGRRLLEESVLLAPATSELSLLSPAPREEYIRKPVWQSPFGRECYLSTFSLHHQNRSV